MIVFPKMRFKCLSFGPCGYYSVDYNHMIKHIWDRHSLEPGFSVTCGIASCVNKFTSDRCFRRHIRSKHKQFHLKYIKFTEEGNKKEANDDDVAIIASYVDDNDNNQEMDHDDDDNKANDENHVSDFDALLADSLIELRERHNLTETALSAVCEKIISVLRIDRKHHCSQIKRSLKNNNPTINLDHETKLILECPSPFNIPLKKYSNTHSLTSFIKAKKEYVEPQEYLLGFQPGSLEKHCTYYIPIPKTLENLLAHEDVLGEVLEYCTETQVDINDKISCYKQYSDGSSFQENMLFKEHQNALQIVFYHDDFQISNPLGNKTFKYKISGFYYTIGNLKAEHKSRLKDIQLAMLCPAKLVKVYSYKTILQPLIDDVKLLESVGVNILFDGSTHHFFATISMVIADNLGAHALGGYYQNFSTVQRFCRFCNRVKDNINDHNCMDVITTKIAYDARLLEVQNDPSLVSFYGIKEPCCLAELKYFHTVDGFPCDLAHDVFEGFALVLLTNLTVHYIKQKILSIDKINERILNFPYAEVDKANKPQILKEKPLTQLKFKQTACESWNLIKLFPLMVSDLIPVGDLYWGLYILFVDMVERLCALSFAESDLIRLEEITVKFLKMYSDLFPDENLKPKAHFLTHYSMNIRKFGPLLKTLRFESKHSYFKNVVANSRNRVNVCKSMVVRHVNVSQLQGRELL